MRSEPGLERARRDAVAVAVLVNPIGLAEVVEVPEPGVVRVARRAGLITAQRRGDVTEQWRVDVRTPCRPPWPGTASDEIISDGAHVYTTFDWMCPSPS